ncbi:TPA: nucleotidyltransferase family protein [Candidatus Micrarchaeota archaeon]|nr:nucleotidyltransferase family protein [Candidatus Micrarchaeota archaeon]
MTELDKKIELIEKHKQELAKDYKVKKIGVFGSYVRGEQRKKSDIDILVDFSETPGLFKFVALGLRLTELLGVKVDLVTKNSLKPNIGKQILKEVVYI